MEFLAPVLDFILLFRGVDDAVMNKKKKIFGLTCKQEGADTEQVNKSMRKTSQASEARHEENQSVQQRTAKEDFWQGMDGKPF